MNPQGFEPIYRNLPLIAQGIGLTLLLTVTTFVIGSVVGLILALARLSPLRVTRWPASGLITFLLSTPPVVHILWVYYALPIVAGIRFSDIEVLVFALSLNASAVMAETYRSGIQAVDPGQRDAAFVLGLSRREAFQLVVLPQAIRIIIPPMASQTINIVKDSSLAGFIGANDLLNVGRFIVTKGFYAIETYSVIALLYFFLTYPIAVAGARLEVRLRRWLRT